MAHLFSSNLAQASSYPMHRVFTWLKNRAAFAAAGPLGHSKTSPKPRNLEGSLLHGYKQSPALLSTVNSTNKNTCAVHVTLYFLFLAEHNTL